ncbi:hypothetical protein J2X76_004913 [Neorhizobium sp. 2083]|uniref:hypothetical protein n=1 Tax=Neorhizobium sp. 2083 TaxID=2817762 RepID=UPI00285AD850|nr:hypothetical protein [Neorhizobium sp. 2083]MDR6819716.1 hypothetical protein [Neorhizobium sp. 2083]
MRSSRVGFAAFVATVSLCVFSGGVTGAVVADGLLGRGALAAEQGVKPGGFGSGTGLGGGALGRTGTGLSGQAGSGSVFGSEALEPGAGTAAGASSNDRAVDRTLELGKPQGKSLGAGAAGGSAKGSGVKDAGDETGKAGATALGKPAEKPQSEDGQSGTAAKTKDADGALEPEAMSTMAAAAPAVGGRPNNAPEKPSIPEITGNGFFTQKIGIDVPGFRGLEPKLSLAYSSARKTRLGGLYQGWLGYAWGLDGFDVIERATPGYGYPAFDAGDIHLLNGEELVTCTTGMVAASCSAGGTHVTENENFKRVIFDAAANTWTVTDRDGTVSLFKSVMAISGSTPASGTPEYKAQHDGRFLLSSVTDTNGNVVNYSYTCPDLPVCYPSVVSYGGMSVNFYYEARPDYLVMANGLGLSRGNAFGRRVDVTDADDPRRLDGQRRQAVVAQGTEDQHVRHHQQRSDARIRHAEEQHPRRDGKSEFDPDQGTDPQRLAGDLRLRSAEPHPASHRVDRCGGQIRRDRPVQHQLHARHLQSRICKNDKRHILEGKAVVHQRADGRSLVMHGHLQSRRSTWTARQYDGCTIFVFQRKYPFHAG